MKDTLNDGDTFLLTKTQQRRLELLGKGIDHKKIAYLEGVSLSAVKATLLAVQKTLGANSNIHAVAIAAQLQIIDILDTKIPSF